MSVFLREEWEWEWEWEKKTMAMMKPKKKRKRMMKRKRKMRKKESSFERRKEEGSWSPDLWVSFGPIPLISLHSLLLFLLLFHQHHIVLDRDRFQRP